MDKNWCYSPRAGVNIPVNYGDDFTVDSKGGQNQFALLSLQITPRHQRNTPITQVITVSKAPLDLLLISAKGNIFSSCINNTKGKQRGKTGTGFLGQAPTGIYIALTIFQEGILLNSIGRIY